MKNTGIKFKINERILVYDASIEDYVTLSKQIDDKGQEILKYIEREYKKSKNIDTINEKFHKTGIRALKEFADYLVQMLADNNIYDISAEELLKSGYYNNSALDIWEQYFYKVKSLFNEILYAANVEKQRREQNKLTRPQFIGGGFGVSGAIKGSIEASAINMATGFAYNIANSISNMATDSNAEERKRALYADSNTLYTLKYGIALAITVLKESFFKIRKLSPFTENYEIKAQNIIQNVARGNIEEKNLEDALVEALQLNPLNGDIYRNYLLYLGDKTNELEDMAKFFYLEKYVHDCKRNILMDSLKDEPDAWEYIDDAEERARDTVIFFVKDGIKKALEDDHHVVCAFYDGVFNYIQPLKNFKDAQVFQDQVNDTVALAKRLGLMDNDALIKKSITSIYEFMAHAFRSDNRQVGVSIEDDNVSGDFNEAILPYQYFHDESITNLQIDGRYKIVGDASFAYCFQLSDLSFDEGVIEIGEAAFAYSNVKTVDFPTTLRTIKRDAFANCKKIESIYVPDGVTTIESGAFKDCDSLKIVRLPDNLDIGEGIFGNHSVSLNCHPNSKTAEYFKDSWLVKLDGVFTYRIGKNARDTYVIGEEYQWIQNEAFIRNKELKEITIPSGIKEIGARAFDTCFHLKSVLIMSGVEKIGKFAFAGCIDLVEIEIPPTVKEICAGAFCGCWDLPELMVIPEGVERLADNFLEGSGVKKLLLPKSLKEIYFEKARPSKDSSYIESNFKDLEFICDKDSYAYKYCVQNGFKVISDPKVFECEQKEAVSRQKTIESNAKFNVNLESGTGCMISIAIIAMIIIIWLLR